MSDVCSYLRSCEEAPLDEGVRHDRAKVAALLSEDFVEFGSSGRVWNRNEILDLLESEAFQPVSVEDFRCKLLSDSVALITYRTRRSRADGQGKSSSLRSSIWTKQEDMWRLRFHQGTRVD
jgi:hypothetical protein